MILRSRKYGRLLLMLNIMAAALICLMYILPQYRDEFGLLALLLTTAAFLLPLFTKGRIAWRIAKSPDYKRLKYLPVISIAALLYSCFWRYTIEYTDLLPWNLAFFVAGLLWLMYISGPERKNAVMIMANLLLAAFLGLSAPSYLNVCFHKLPEKTKNYKLARKYYRPPANYRQSGAYDFVLEADSGIIKAESVEVPRRTYDVYNPGDYVRVDLYTGNLGAKYFVIKQQTEN